MAKGGGAAPGMGGGGTMLTRGMGSYGSGPTEFLSGAGTSFGQIQDPIAQIAARIGQLQSRDESMMFNPSRPYGYRETVRRETSPLEQLLELYQQKLKDEHEMQAFQLDQARRQSKSSPSGGSIETNFSGGNGFGGLPTGGGGGNPRTGGPYYLMDPYADVRAAAKEAAKRYLRGGNG